MSLRPPFVRATHPRAALLAALLAIAAGCGASEDPRPDLLLVSVDTLRADRLVCYGGEPGLGEAICGIAEGGIRYVWPFATAPSTGPSIASLLTSRYPSEHGMQQATLTRLADEAVTVAERLHEAGYATAAIVSNPVLRAERNLIQGFDHYDDEMTRREPQRPDWREREAEATTAAALRWVEQASRPWFLWVHYQDPHGPYAPPGGSEAQDTPGDPPLRVLRDHSGWRGIPAYQRIPRLRTLGGYERRYADEIRYLDGWVRNLLEGVAATGARPAILLTADHGEAFGEDDFYLAHGHALGLDQIRVPLLYRPSEAGPSAVVSEPVSVLDVAPTLLAEAGLPRPESFRGEPLSRQPPSPRTLFAEHRLRIAAVAEGVHYARDRAPLDEPVPDRISGGRVPPLPPRATALEASGSFRMLGEGPPPALEARVAEHLSAQSDAGAMERDGSELDPETEETLRSLGYLE